MTKIERELAIINLKIDSMTTLEIAELVGQRHDHVMDAVKKLVDTKVILHVPEIRERAIINGLGLKNTYSFYNLLKRDCFVVVALFSPEFTGKLVDRWQFLEEQLYNLKHSKDNPRLQMDAMAALHDLLPDGIKKENLPYIKANTVVNKATSNLYGFKKMLNKNDMSPDMLESREKIMDDYLKLYDVFENNSEVKEALYRKWQPKRLTTTII
jgi:phage regulator Rha-like protein